MSQRMHRRHYAMRRSLITHDTSGRQLRSASSRSSRRVLPSRSSVTPRSKRSGKKRPFVDGLAKEINSPKLKNRHLHRQIKLKKSAEKQVANHDHDSKKKPKNKHHLCRQEKRKKPEEKQVADHTSDSKNKQRTKRHRKILDVASFFMDPGPPLFIGKSQRENTMTSEAPYKCDKCGARYVVHASLVRHLKVHNQTLSYIPCRTCGLLFEDSDSCSKHFSEKHKPISKGKQAESAASKDEDQYGFKCEACEAVFAYEKTLLQHLVVHKEEKPFTCPVCGVAFSHPFDLKAHVDWHLSCSAGSQSQGKRQPLQKAVAHPSPPKVYLLQKDFQGDNGRSLTVVVEKHCLESQVEKSLQDCSAEVKIDMVLGNLSSARESSEVSASPSQVTKNFHQSQKICLNGQRQTISSEILDHQSLAESPGNSNGMVLFQAMGTGTDLSLPSGQLALDSNRSTQHHWEMREESFVVKLEPPWASDFDKHMSYPENEASNQSWKISVNEEESVQLEPEYPLHYELPENLESKDLASEISEVHHIKIEHDPVVECSCPDEGMQSAGEELTSHRHTNASEEKLVDFGPDLPVKQEPVSEEREWVQEVGTVSESETCCSLQMEENDSLLNSKAEFKMEAGIYPVHLYCNGQIVKSFHIENS